MHMYHQIVEMKLKKNCDYNIVILTAEIECRKMFSRNVLIEYTDVISKHKFRCIVKFSL